MSNPELESQYNYSVTGARRMGVSRVAAVGGMVTVGITETLAVIDNNPYMAVGGIVLFMCDVALYVRGGRMRTIRQEQSNTIDTLREYEAYFQDVDPE